MRSARLLTLALFAVSLASACGDGDPLARSGDNLGVQPDADLGADDDEPKWVDPPPVILGPGIPPGPDGQPDEAMDSGSQTSAEGGESADDAGAAMDAGAEPNVALVMDSGKPDSLRTQVDSSDGATSADDAFGSESSPEASSPPEPIGGGLDASPDAESDAADASAPADAADATAPPDDAGPDGASAPDTGISDEQLRQLFRDRLRTCGFVGPGEFEPRPIEDAHGRCAARCALQTECPILRRVLCAEGNDTVYQTCIANCARLPVESGFVCGALTIWPSLRCNGANNCRPTGEDEQGCESYTCASGQTLTNPFARCDGRAQCTDGSDELGCATVCPEAGVATL